MKQEKLVYIYNDDLSYSHCEVFNGTMPKNSTFNAPQDFEPWTYDKSSDSWTGVSEEEYLKAHPIEAPEPSSQDKMNAMLLKDNLEMKKMIAELKGGTN